LAVARPTPLPAPVIIAILFICAFRPFLPGCHRAKP
jgi:hypothetical protein